LEIKSCLNERDRDFRVMRRPLGPMNFLVFLIGSIFLPSTSNEAGVWPLRFACTKKCMAPSVVDSQHGEYRFLHYRFQWEASGRESGHRPSERGFSQGSFARCGYPCCCCRGRSPSRHRLPGLPVLGSEACGAFGPGTFAAWRSNSYVIPPPSPSARRHSRSRSTRRPAQVSVLIRVPMQGSDSLSIAPHERRITLGQPRRSPAAQDRCAAT
jgi:hypothetical protein